MMRMILLAVTCISAMAIAHNSYTGGYSSAPGRSTCALSCHGGSAGTLVVAGFPAMYQPLQSYTIVVRHNGGSKIVNFNATTRVGSTSTIAGTFVAVTNSILYTGIDGGVYASPHSIDSAVFQWTAPAAGSGAVNFYVAGFQGTTSSSNGQSSRVTFSASEITTGVNEQASPLKQYILSQNFPNPFNPTTTIAFSIPGGSMGRTNLRVFDLCGNEVATLVDGFIEAGNHHVMLDATNMASGLYFYRLEIGPYTSTKRLFVLK